MSDHKDTEWTPSEGMMFFLRRAESEAAWLQAPSAEQRTRGLAAMVASHRYEEVPKMKELLADGAPIFGSTHVGEVRNDALIALQELHLPVSEKLEVGIMDLRASWPLTDMWRAYREAMTLVPADLVAQARERALQYLADHVMPSADQREAALAYCMLRELGLVAYEQQEVDPVTGLTTMQQEIYLRQVESRPTPPCLRVALLQRPSDTLCWMYRDATGGWTTRVSDHPATSGAIDCLTWATTITKGGVPRVEHDEHGSPKRTTDGRFVTGPALDKQSPDHAGYLRSIAAFMSISYTTEVFIESSQLPAAPGTLPIDRVRLALDGLSIGDAFGERFLIEPQRIHARFLHRQIDPAPWPWTDDTQMALSIVELMITSGTIAPDELVSRFAARYQPFRGYGRAAHDLLQRVREGAAWEPVARGLFDGQGSKGNGAAMRAAPIGAFFAHDLDRVVLEARNSAIVTHTHPDGIAGAIATAVAAAIVWQTRNANPDPKEILRGVLARTPAGAVADGIAAAIELPDTTTTLEAARILGNGSYVIASDTVPFALWSAVYHCNRFDDALWATASALGDIDTTCAIVGGIVALRVGATGIPSVWRQAREPLPAEIEALLQK
jgi:ADP-ribosylglycohydrolase